MKIGSTEVKKVKMYRAEDLDQDERNGGKFLAFCTDHEIFVQGTMAKQLGNGKGQNV